MTTDKPKFLIMEDEQQLHEALLFLTNFSHLWHHLWQLLASLGCFYPLAAFGCFNCFLLLFLLLLATFGAIFGDFYATFGQF